MNKIETRRTEGAGYRSVPAASSDSRFADSAGRGLPGDVAQAGPMSMKLRFSTARRDLLLCVVVIVGLFLLAGSFDVFEMWFEFSRTHEDWELDEIVTAMTLSFWAFAWFAWRRWRGIRARGHAQPWSLGTAPQGDRRAPARSRGAAGA